MFMSSIRALTLKGGLWTHLTELSREDPQWLPHI